jgi:hypothetical protein
VRVDVPVASSLHLTADITCYASGTCAADVQFNNDLAMTRSGGTFTFSAAVTLNGTTRQLPAIVQDQYQDWHVVVGGAPAPNVRHDIAYLEATGAVLHYDLKLGVSGQTLQTYEKLARSRGFGAPLAGNGITTYMPTTGGRPDIGYQTQFNTVWLVTQDARAAAVGLAQGDTGGAVPWNMKLRNGHWLTPADYPNIWDPTGDLPLTQQTANTTWTPDAAHEPDLGYVPYLMTAQRWYLDRLNAEFAWDLTFDYPPNRCTANPCIRGQAENLINGQQLRAAAWSMREAIEAAWIGKTGSFEARYAEYAAHESWDWVIAQETQWTAQEGQVAGWFSGAGWAGSGSTFYAAPWQQDFFDGIAIQAAGMGDIRAQQILAWDSNWILGRFAGQGMNPNDGCASSLAVLNNVTYAPLTTWDQIEQENVAVGLSNGTGWANSQGYYCSTWRAVLGGLLALNPSNTLAQQALAWLNGAGAPYVNAPAYQQDPTWNVVP